MSANIGIGIGSKIPACSWSAAAQPPLWLLRRMVEKCPVTVVLERDEAGLRFSSMVNLAQIPTLDESRLRRMVGVLSQARLGEVDNAIVISLGLGE